MATPNRYFITTAIPYVNSNPHIGFALEIVQADSFARFHRLVGDDTWFLTGTDENALKNVQAAEAEGISTRALVDRTSQRFQQLRQYLDISYDQFIRTSVDPQHAAASAKLWRAVAESGDIYKQYYSGLYCVGCEQYYNPSELIDGLCPEHGVPPDLIEEENYFFRLSRYADQLYQIISSDGYRIVPESRKNEALSFISRGLQDFSISRSRERARGWGIPVPDDPSQVIYVWFDALINYISALGYADEGSAYKHYWLDNPHRVHTIGKGVIRFHAIYWPAMLLSAGVPLPTTLFVHGYINVDGAKMSKSIGNVVDPVQLVEQYGVDAVRYYFLRAVSPTGDANFRFEHFEARYRADLANDLGNLLNRTVSMIGRYRGGSIPEPGSRSDLDRAVERLASRIPETVREAVESYDPQSALDAVWELVGRANKYVEEAAPWSLAKAARGGDEAADLQLSTTLYTLAESLRVIATLLEPFLPGTAVRIHQQLGTHVPGTVDWNERLAWGRTAAGTQVGRPEPLFPRLENEAPAVSSA